MAGLSRRMMHAPHVSCVHSDLCWPSTKIQQITACFSRCTFIDGREHSLQYFRQSQIMCAQIVDAKLLAGIVDHNIMHTTYMVHYQYHKYMYIIIYIYYTIYYVYIYIYIFIYICVCVCVCVHMSSSLHSSLHLMT